MYLGSVEKKKANSQSAINCCTLSYLLWNDKKKNLWASISKQETAMQATYGKAKPSVNIRG